MELFHLSKEEMARLSELVGSEVPLEDMLNARERRVFCQKELLSSGGGSLISFTLNIPGPVKLLPGTPEAFLEGLSRIDAALKKAQYRVLEERLLLANTGAEAFFLVDALPRDVKALLVPIEDCSSRGRLCDMDVLDREGNKISRQELGMPERKCLLCEKPARECARSRAHSVEELTRHVSEILAETFGKDKTYGI